jgi:hypothetical protein
MLSLKCAVVSLYLFVKQQLKCNTGKVCNCLIQFLLAMVHEKVVSAQRISERTVYIQLLSLPERIFLHPV